MSEKKAIVVMTTVGDEDHGNSIAGELIGRRHAACVNMVPGIRSVYRWQGKICRDTEIILLVKTLESEYEAVVETIRELHEYEVPEILSFEVGHVDPPFLDWIASSLDKDAAFDEDEELPDVD